MQVICSKIEDVPTKSRELHVTREVQVVCALNKHSRGERKTRHSNSSVHHAE